MRFLKRYFSKIELVQLLAKMTRFWRFLMRKLYFPSKMKLPPPKIDFRPTFGTFLLFYYTMFSTDFTVDFFEPVFTYEVLLYKRCYNTSSCTFLAPHPPLHLLHIIVKKQVLAVRKKLTTLVIIHQCDIHSPIVITMIQNLVLTR